MTKDQRGLFMIVVLLLFFGLLTFGLWMTSWYFSFKIFATAFIVLGAGATFLSVVEEIEKAKKYILDFMNWLK